MTQGRSIRLFLVDGTPNGLPTAEIMNWTGHVLTGPRSKLSELVGQPEVSRTGVYFLVGPDPGNSFRSLVYIGESDDVGHCTLVNGTAHDYINLPEADLADMAFFLEQIRTVLPVLGFNFLRDSSRPASPPEVQTAPPRESQRGLIIEDRQRARHYLSQLNDYLDRYRLPPGPVEADHATRGPAALLRLMEVYDANTAATGFPTDRRDRPLWKA